MKRILALLVLLSVSLPMWAEDKPQTPSPAALAAAQTEEPKPAEDPNIIVMADLPLLSDCNFFPSKFATCEPSYCLFGNREKDGKISSYAVAIGGVDQGKCFFRYEARTDGETKSIIHCLLDTWQNTQMADYYFKFFHHLSALNSINYSKEEKQAAKTAHDNTPYPVLDFLKTGACEVRPAYK